MLEFIKEKESLWEYLKKTTKSIYIYGMGDGALKIISVLEQLNITLAGIYASDEFVRGHSFYGFIVKRLDQVKAEAGEFITLLAFATQREPLLSHIYEMSEELELYAPDVPVVKTDDELFDIDFIKKHENEFDFVYNHLSDELSKKVLIDILNFKVSGKIGYLKGCSTEIGEVYTHIIKPTSNEVYVDLGAYNGDTVVEFLSYANSAAKIVAFEPDKKNFKRLNKTLLEKDITAECYNIGAWSCEDTLYFQGGKGGRNSKLNEFGQIDIPVNSVDNILLGKEATLIKLDVEGAETSAIQGCEKTITQFSPKLMVSSYHKNDDLFSLPIQLLKLNPNYKVFLRHHPYIPAWETNYYFI
ncbi:MAG: FkbM family methyltransferase [Oscillospiraceae bacterium]